MKTFWTTFYSYKGGVGRSLALANVAALLVKRGHRVVLLDFDLEAPGLDTFEEFKETKDRPGILEYVAEFQRNQVAPDIKSYVHQVQLPQHLRGKLWVIPAGRKDKAYNYLLSHTRWAELLNDDLGAPFIENWKVSIEHEYRPDYVLIDSRTGLTEVGGVCTTAFPDLVVMLFGLNEQNVQGTATVGRYIREAGLERLPQLYFVATPIPNLPPEKNSILQSRFESAEKTLGVELKSGSLRFWPIASLTERLFVLDDAFATTVLVQDYLGLCRKIREFNRNGLDFLADQTEAAIKDDNTEIANRLSDLLFREYPDRAEAVFLRSRLARLNRRPGDSLQLAEQAFELDPRYEPPFEFLCAQYRRSKNPEKIESLCERILAQPLSTPYRSDVLSTLAELQMSLRKYEPAAANYAAVLNLSAPAKEDDEDEPSPARMVVLFNAAESGRRGGKPVPVNFWKQIVSIYEHIPAYGGSPTVTASHCQLIHIAYALSGDLSKAQECLRRALSAAETVNDLETIFSVRDYRFVTRDEFRSTTEELLAALKGGELWDGTKLPTAGPGLKEM